MTARRKKMTTMSPRIENGRIHDATRSATRSPREAVVRVASSAVRRFMPERWLSDLLVLALGGLLVGATALYGLAVVSTWVPTPNPPTADRLMRGEWCVGTAWRSHEPTRCEEGIRWDLRGKPR